jgi:hypothetical protein
MGLRRGACGEGLGLYGPQAGRIRRTLERVTDLPTFAGRERELSQLSAMLRPGSEYPGTVAIYVIDGMAGIGKTTFALHWAHHVVKHFEDGQLYLNLRGFDSSESAAAPAEALCALLYSLGVPPRHIPGDPTPVPACTGVSWLESESSLSWTMPVTWSRSVRFCRAAQGAWSS